MLINETRISCDVRFDIVSLLSNFTNANQVKSVLIQSTIETDECQIYQRMSDRLFRINDWLKSEITCLVLLEFRVSKTRQGFQISSGMFLDQ